MKETKATVVITSYNQKEELIHCLEWIKGISEVANIIIADNASEDGTAEFLSQSGYPYLFFDEGVQGYGTLCNAVIDNFDLEEFIIFMEPRYFLGFQCVLRMIEVLKMESCGMVGPMSNGFKHFQHYSIHRIENLCKIENDLMYCENVAKKVLCIEKGIWGISKKILTENGRFDEEIVSSKNVVLDYELRMVQKGYLPMISHRSLAFCNCVNQQKADFECMLGKCDRDILKEKWHMNYFNLIPANNIVDFIKEQKEARVRILEVGCDLGVTLLEIKNRYPNAQIYGLEINPASAEIAKHLAEVKVGNIEDQEIPFEGAFDYIIFGDVLEHLHDPQGIVRFCREKLTERGCILTSIPNVMHVTVMEQLLKGRFEYQDTGLLDRSHIHFFTFYEILRLFQEESYNIEEMKTTTVMLNEDDKELIRKLMKISENVEEHMYTTFQYLGKARKNG